MVSNTDIYCLHTVKWFQVLLFNTYNSISPIDGIQTGTTTLARADLGVMAMKG